MAARGTSGTRDRADSPPAAGAAAAAGTAAPDAVSITETSLVAQNAGVGVDTLYYDGSCPLCASEIDNLRKTRGDGICLVDIHAVNDSVGRASAHSPVVSPVPSPATSAADPSGLSPARSSGENYLPGKDELLRTLHLKRADGSWLTGADANVAAWEGTAQERRLRVLRWPVLRHIVDLGYALWARWRYWRLYGRQFDERRHAPDKTGH